MTSLFQATGVTDALLVPAQVGSRPRSLSQHQTVRQTPKKRDKPLNKPTDIVHLSGFA